MDLNISLIKKIERILDMSSKFDKLCTDILGSNAELNKSNIQNIKDLTSLYMLIRADHGSIIMLNDKLKKNIDTKKSSFDDEMIGKLYDLSTFTSIADNINNLVSNVDFEFKKIALMYPKLINKQTNHILLFLKKNDKENKYVKMIEEIKKLRPENEYHVIECKDDEKKVDCSEMMGIKITLAIKELPCLYLVNGTNIVEIPMDQLKNCGDLIKMLD